MKAEYEIRLGERVAMAEVERLEGDRFRVTLDGEAIELEARDAADGLLHLMGDDGRSYEVSVRDGDPMTVGVYDSVFELEVRDERERMFDLLGGGGATGGPAEVASPMPGRVVDLCVTIGQEVAEGEPVVIVEAMKMENALTATRAGKVTEILVAPGDSVESGQGLVVIGAAAPEEGSG